jgi:hypothetical protein
VNYFTANIDKNNIQTLRDASKRSGVEFKQGVYMTKNNKIQFSFYPVFCETKEKAIQLLKTYFQVAEKTESTANLHNDLYMISKNEVTIDA